jgi:opine dehydrogenase
MNHLPRITVCGAGNAGLSIAGDCALNGHAVTLFELESQQAQITPVMEAGGIQVSDMSVTLSGKTGFASLACATVDPEQAAAGADVIMITVPAMYHTLFFDTLTPFLKEGQIILFNTSYWACLRHARQRERLDKKVILAASNTMPYAAFRDSGNTVHIRRSKDRFRVASFPGESGDAAFETLSRIYPQFQKAATVFDIDIAAGGNPAMTVPMVLPVAGWYFDRYMGGKLYADATLMGSRLMRAYDEDRKRLSACLNSPNYESQLTYYTTVYGAQGNDMAQIMRTSNLIDWWADSTYIRQLVEEDLIYAYVPMVRLADALGVDIAATRGMVELMGTMLDEDYWRRGVSLEQMGLAGMDRARILEFVMTGRT